MRRFILAAGLVLATGVAMAADQAGTLQPGASVTLDTQANGPTEITLKNESDQKVIVAASGAISENFALGPVQTIGALKVLKGARLTLTNKGAVPVTYKVGGW